MKLKTAKTEISKPMQGDMRKEIIGIFLFFFVLLIFISLLSYSPADPSINHSVPKIHHIHNFFGLVGAHLSGLLVGLFGLGSFWIPALLILLTLHIRGNEFGRTIASIVTGGILLVVATGSFLALWQDSYSLFGNKFSSGGIIGILLASFFLKYTNFAGGTLILILLWIIGFIMATGFSLLKFTETCRQAVCFALQRIKTFWILWKQKREKTKTTLKIKPQKVKKPVERPVKNPVESSVENPVESSVENPVESSGENPVESSGENPVESSGENPVKGPVKKLVKTLMESSVKNKEQEIKIVPAVSKNVPPYKPKVPGFTTSEAKFQRPSINFLNDPQARPDSIDHENLKMQSKLLESKLEDFGVKGKVVTVSPGPVITTFEYQPAPGIKINKIINLTDDLALALCALSIRIVAPIPGKDVIGIEIPNTERESVTFKEIVVSAAFEKSKSKLTLCLGKDIVGNPVVAEMDKMPHLLIAGATGTGKSVALNAMITSLLYKSTPEEVKLIMIDPKRIELSVYNGIPHLITPVVTDMKKATNALFWAVREMERRYEILAEKKVRNIKQYNQKVSKENKEDEEEYEKNPPEKLPFIVIIIDELADLMMVSSRDVEVALTRLAQMARAAGIHLVLATQRPSVDVLTGIIKANFPTRLSFQVSSKTDSRTIIDTNGAENLLGNGDMLFLPPGTAKLQRIHGSFISDEELGEVIDFLKDQQQPEYVEEVTESHEEKKATLGDEEYDEKYDEAVAFVTKTRQASISMIQRHFRIGYNRAARIIEVMEKEGIVGPSDGAKPREVLVQGYDEMS